MREISVHPSVMRRLLAGKPVRISVIGGDDIREGDAVTVTDDDKVNTVVTRVKGIDRRIKGLTIMLLDDYATAFGGGDYGK